MNNDFQIGEWNVEIIVFYTVKMQTTKGCKKKYNLLFRPSRTSLVQFSDCKTKQVNGITIVWRLKKNKQNKREGIHKW